MSNFYKPVSTEINAPTTAATASDVSNGRVVRAVNTAATTAHLLTMYAAADGGSDSATMSIAGGDTIIIPKEKTDKIFAANAAVKLTKITYPKG